MAKNNIEMQPIGIIYSERHDPIDDQWDKVKSIIEIDPHTFRPEALVGLNEFSHCEVIYFFHKVAAEKIERGSRHPRGNKDWPQVGIFSQRAKDRPNRIGSTICRILSVDGLKVTVEGLDAIDRTPVLDIKPYISEFGARGAVRQPNWSSDLMKNYW